MIEKNGNLFSIFNLPFQMNTLLFLSNVSSPFTNLLPFFEQHKPADWAAAIIIVICFIGFLSAKKGITRTKKEEKILKKNTYLSYEDMKNLADEKNLPKQAIRFSAFAPLLRAKPIAVSLPYQNCTILLKTPSFPVLTPLGRVPLLLYWSFAVLPAPL